MTNHFISNRYQAISSNPITAMAAKAKNYDDVINFSVGDPDLNTPLPIIEAAFEDAKKGYTHYGDTMGDVELRKAICEMYKEDYDLDFNEKEVFISASANVAMHIVMESCLNDGDEVIVIAPYFSIYKGCIEMARGVCVECPTYFEDRFQINEETLEGCITEKTKAIILNTPTNPTGNCYTLESLQKIADLAKKYDLLIVADDIYTIYSYSQPFYPIVMLPGMKERTVTINSFSKNYLMTGWRLGNVIATEDMIKVFREVNESMVYTAPMISQRAALYGIQHRKEIQPAIAAEYQKRLDYAVERINQIPKLHVLSPAGGTFYLFVDIRDTGMSSVEFANWLLEKAHIVTVPGDGFGQCGEGFVRLAVTLSVDKMKEAFDRLDKIEELH